MARDCVVSFSPAPVSSTKGEARLMIKSTISLLLHPDIRQAVQYNRSKSQSTRRSVFLQYAQSCSSSGAYAKEQVSEPRYALLHLV